MICYDPKYQWCLVCVFRFLSCIREGLRRRTLEGLRRRTFKEVYVVIREGLRHTLGLRCPSRRFTSYIRFTFYIRQGFRCAFKRRLYVVIVVAL